MLVNRKQQNDVYEQHEAPSIIRSLPKLDIALRAKCLTTVILIAIVAIFVTVRSEAIIRAGYDLVQIKSQALSLQRENELLRLDIAKLKSPQRIQYIATAELGMVMPQSVYRVESTPKSMQPNTEKEKKMVSQVVNTKR
jgi:cell division protein FtsL